MQDTLERRGYRKNTYKILISELEKKTQFQSQA
jgi:hypothetical protein